MPRARSIITLPVHYGVVPGEVRHIDHYMDPTQWGKLTGCDIPREELKKFEMSKRWSRALRHESHDQAHMNPLGYAPTSDA